MFFIDCFIECRQTRTVSFPLESRVSLLSIYAQKQRSDRTWTACPLPGADGEGGDPAEEILRGIDLQTEAILENVLGEKTVLVARDEISQVASKNDVAE